MLRASAPIVVMASESGEAILSAESALRAGAPKAALTALTLAVKADPAQPRLRIFLAQLLCVLGQWERAHTQLNVLADLDSAAMPMREMVSQALHCEKLRAAVFAGRRSPMIFGEPEVWLGSLIESQLLFGAGESELGSSLAATALEAAPASRGRVDGTAFEWIADADSRLGPVLEAMINGRYYWIPFNRLLRIAIEPPTDLRDKIWLPTHLQFANGGEVIAMLPVRYPGSELSNDDQILLSAKTVWAEDGPERWLGLGQRVLITDQGEHDLLSVRLIELEPERG